MGVQGGDFSGRSATGVSLGFDGADGPDDVARIAAKEGGDLIEIVGGALADEIGGHLSRPDNAMLAPVSADLGNADREPRADQTDDMSGGIEIENGLPGLGPGGFQGDGNWIGGRVGFHTRKSR